MNCRLIRPSMPAAWLRIVMSVVALGLLFSVSSFAAPLASTTYDGGWKGTTSQGENFSFTVVNDAITSIEARFVLPGCAVTQTITVNLPISGGAFSLSVSGTSIQGTFVSLVSATGTVQYTSTTPFCVGTVSATWSATRQGGPPITSTSTATSTSTPTATSAGTPTLMTTPLPLSGKVVYVAIARKQEVPTPVPPTRTPTVTATLPPAGSVPRVVVREAQEETELRCSVPGGGSYTQHPNPGYTFVIVDFNVIPPAGQSLSFKRSDVSIVGNDGVAYEAQGDDQGNSGSYCLGGTAVFFIPGTTAAYSFAFVPLKDTVAHDYRLRFPNAAEVVFKATPK